MSFLSFRSQRAICKVCYSVGVVFDDRKVAKSCDSSQSQDKFERLSGEKYISDGHNPDDDSSLQQDTSRTVICSNWGFELMLTNGAGIAEILV